MASFQVLLSRNLRGSTGIPITHQNIRSPGRDFNPGPCKCEATYSALLCMCWYGHCCLRDARNVSREIWAEIRNGKKTDQLYIISWNYRRKRYEEGGRVLRVPRTKPAFFWRGLRKSTKTFGQDCGDKTGFRNGPRTRPPVLWDTFDSTVITLFKCVTNRNSQAQWR